MAKIICFDVDGTLVEGNSWLRLTEKLGCNTKNHLRLWNLAKNNELAIDQCLRELIAMYRDGGRANKYFLGNVFNDVTVRSSAKEVMKHLRRKGYKIFLVSESVDLFVKKVADILEIENYLANASLEFCDDGTLEHIHYKPNQGRAKLDQIRTISQRFSCPLENIICVGDSNNDIEIFKTTRGIAVH